MRKLEYERRLHAFTLLSQGQNYSLLSIEMLDLTHCAVNTCKHETNVRRPRPKHARIWNSSTNFGLYRIRKDVLMGGPEAQYGFIRQYSTHPASHKTPDWIFGRPPTRAFARVPGPTKPNKISINISLIGIPLQHVQTTERGGGHKKAKSPSTSSKEMKFWRTTWKLL